MTHSPIEFVSESTVSLVDHMGNDQAIVSAARVDPEVPEEWKDGSDDDLLFMLMSRRHGTPFEHASVKYFIETPIFIAREHFRHRIGSFNEFSTRYKRVGSQANPARFYIPPIEDFRTQVGTIGNYTFEPMSLNQASNGQNSLRYAAQVGYDVYCVMLEAGHAKEVARNALGFSTMTKYLWTVNPRSLMNFLSLRLEKTALLEIQRVAEDVDSIFAGLFPRTHRLFHDCGMVAP